MPAYLLGIDTGGTYTDAVLFESGIGLVRSAKSLTTRPELENGVTAAVESVLGDVAAQVEMVSISTTLATNAVVEGQGANVCLILIGQKPGTLERAGLREALADSPVCFIEGGHQASGDPRGPLDEATLITAIRTHRETVDAFAVAAQFSVRNPAHELLARDIIRRETGLPVTCSHELSHRLDAPRRALTALLNARLVPLISRLVTAVQHMMTVKGLDVPLMVVKGDGSLVAANVAMERPVETVLSGPAASVVGGAVLAEAKDVVLVDMGGTTSDIAIARNGVPRIEVAGALLGGWRTMVEAVGVSTVGLGGDSEVRFDAKRLTIGPRRVLPLSALVYRFPHLLTTLEEAQAFQDSDRWRFAFKINDPPTALSRYQKELMDTLAQGPRAIADIATDRVLKGILDLLVRRGWVAMAGFTPTDAAHVLGVHTPWRQDAAVLAARCFARRAAEVACLPDADEGRFCEWVFDTLATDLAKAIVHAVRVDEEGDSASVGPGTPDWFLHRALGAPVTDSLLNYQLTLNLPLLAVGAPAAAYFPAVAEKLHTPLMVPKNGDVANALGAVAAGVVQNVQVTITSPQVGLYRMHGQRDVQDFASEDEALAAARRDAGAVATERAQLAGAKEVELRFAERVERTTSGSGEELFIEAWVTATAVGRPRIGRVLT